MTGTEVTIDELTTALRAAVDGLSALQIRQIAVPEAANVLAGEIAALQARCAELQAEIDRREARP